MRNLLLIAVLAVMSSCNSDTADISSYPTTPIPETPSTQIPYGYSGDMVLSPHLAESRACSGEGLSKENGWKCEEVSGPWIAWSNPNVEQQPLYENCSGGCPGRGSSSSDSDDDDSYLPLSVGMYFGGPKGNYRFVRLYQGGPRQRPRTDVVLKVTDICTEESRIETRTLPFGAISRKLFDYEEPECDCPETWEVVSFLDPEILKVLDPEILEIVLSVEYRVRQRSKTYDRCRDDDEEN